MDVAQARDGGEYPREKLLCHNPVVSGTETEKRKEGPLQDPGVCSLGSPWRIHTKLKVHASEFHGHVV